MKSDAASVEPSEYNQLLCILPQVYRAVLSWFTLTALVKLVFREALGFQQKPPLYATAQHQTAGDVSNYLVNIAEELSEVSGEQNIYTW